MADPAEDDCVVVVAAEYDIWDGDDRNVLLLLLLLLVLLEEVGSDGDEEEDTGEAKPFGIGGPGGIFFAGAPPH